MLAPQNQTSDITDSLNGSLTTWYQNVDSALKASECVPGYYEYAQAPSYGTQCPIQEVGSTKIDIDTAKFNVISLENSYIDVEFTAPITFPAIHTGNYTNTDGTSTVSSIYYIGFKNAFDLIDSYRIYSNGDLIYTQNHANFESFLNYISLTDNAKENSENYATHNKVVNMKDNVPGTYIRFDKQPAATTIPVTIKFKIPLTSFMMLQNLKWFPGFMGRITIEIFPTYRNLVWCRFDDNGAFNSLYKYIGDKIPTGIKIDNNNPTGQKTELAEDAHLFNGEMFQQINSSLDSNVAYEAGDVNEWQIVNNALSANTSTLVKFHLYEAYYMLKMDIYNALEYNYLQIPLLFPIQTVSNVKFTSPLGSNQFFTLQNTATLSHCDTVFVVFPSDVNSRTCFSNPEINCHLNINGKYYPRERVRTVEDVRFYNMELDALNINNNPLVSISEDVYNSISPYKHSQEADLETTHTLFNVYICKYNKDRSNFFIGVPLSTDDDFMGGISTNGSTVQIELIGERASTHNANINNMNWSEAPEAIFLEDKILKIYSMKPIGGKQIDITNATLEQIIASGGQV